MFVIPPGRSAFVRPAGAFRRQCGHRAAIPGNRQRCAFGIVNADAAAALGLPEAVPGAVAAAARCAPGPRTQPRVRRWSGTPSCGAVTAPAAARTGHAAGKAAQTATPRTGCLMPG